MSFSKDEGEGSSNFLNTSKTADMLSVPFGNISIFGDIILSKSYSRITDGFIGLPVSLNSFNWGYNSSFNVLTAISFSKQSHIPSQAIKMNLVLEVSKLTVISH